MPESENDTQELPISMLPLPDALPVAVKFEFGSSTHVGRRRETNEDHFAVVRRCRSREIISTNVNTSGLASPNDETYSLIVADGLGGTGHGEVASELILRIGWELTSAESSWTMKFRTGEWSKIRAYVTDLARRMQTELLSHAHADPRLIGMGTTWTCYYLMGPHALLAHVGDSRAYLFRNRILEQQSRDHNFAQQLEDVGVPPAEAAPFRHILTNAFRADDGNVEIDVSHVPLQNGDRLLLCTDGLSSMVPDSEIAATLASNACPQEACERLIEQALAGGGKDNVTVVIADVHFEDV
jgi:protein phosphatase